VTPSFILGHTFASLCLGHEPKVRVVTKTKWKQNKVMIKNVPKINVEQTKGNEEFYLYLYPLGT